MSVGLEPLAAEPGPTFRASLGPTKITGAGSNDSPSRRSFLSTHRGTEAMLPSRDQIERAAYLRWERRGRMHGADAEDWVSAEMDQIFDLNYRTAVEYELAEDQQRVLGNPKNARCRFCEQSAPRAAFSVRPCVARGRRRSILAYPRNLRRVRRPVRQDHRSRLRPVLGIACRPPPRARLLSRAQGPHRHPDRRLQVVDPYGAGDHARGPAFQLHGHDRVGLAIPITSSTAACSVARVACFITRHVPFPTGWTSLCHRLDDDSPFPYMLFFLGLERVVLQVHLPLCSRDDDLDGSELEMPERSFSTGVGSDLRPSTCLVLPLKASDQAKPRRFRLFW